MGGEPPPWRGRWNLELKGPGRGWTGEACSRREVSGHEWLWGPGWEGLLSCAQNLAPEQQRLWETPPTPSTGAAVWEESTQLCPCMVGDEAELCPPNHIHMNLRRDPHVEGGSVG